MLVLRAFKARHSAIACCIAVNLAAISVEAQVAPSSGTPSSSPPTVSSDSPAPNGPPTSDSVAAAALASSSSLRAARAGVRTAEAQRDEVWWQFWPSLNLSASYVRLSWVPTIALPDLSVTLHAAVERRDFTCVDSPSTAGCQGNIELTSSILDRFALRAGLSVPITDILFRATNAYEAARRTVEARRADVETAERQVSLRAREAYFAYQRALSRDTVARSAIDLARRRRDDAARLVDAGRLARVDLVRADAAIADAQRTASTTRIDVEISAAELRRRMGLSEEAPLPVPGTEEAPTITERFAEIQNGAIDRTPEIRSLDQQIRALDATAASARVAEFPSLVAFGNFEYSNPNPRIFPLVRQFIPSWDVGVTVAWSPVAALAASSTVTRVRAQRSYVEAVRDETRENLTMELRVAWIEARAARDRIQLAHESVVAAEANQRALRDRFAAGQVSLTDLTIADTELLRVQQLEADARVDALVAVARLRRLTADVPRRR